MAPQQHTDFVAFRRAHATTVFDVALRHSGDTGTAVACVDAVFSELARRWHAVADPLRFIRRTAVLFVYGSRRRVRRCRSDRRIEHRTSPALSVAG